MTKGHGKGGQWWVTIDGRGDTKYPSVGNMRVDKHGHYEQRYGRSKKKSTDLIDAIRTMRGVVIAEEELLPDGIYKKNPDGHFGLFEVLNFKVTFFGMHRTVEFDVGECSLPLDG